MENEIILTDVYEVAILLVLGEKYKEMGVVDSKVRFIFGPGAKKYLKQFYESDLTIDPKKYKHSIQDVRSIIYGMKKSSQGVSRNVKGQ